ncbi:MAG TPA: ferredoxin [Phycisphaerae bacterium]|jgi:ferredoxin|nr:ferredoxin [Phycisphaerae bacterium]HOB74264.1 ferredoxin [Phycisphaerae bacterium]HOJ53145.1 ferredoxin [Phycisphaerae bacterium]HOL24882.1 ferredoxin [Phycisphaerae bacterium]HPP19418.1 ferredoxin [Phycisphaerae bacterium]
MLRHKPVAKVWIDPGCIVCSACETTCPDVFEVRETTCVIRPEALHAPFLQSRGQMISDAAEECPVQVIKFETIECEEPSHSL